MPCPDTPRIVIGTTPDHRVELRIEGRTDGWLAGTCEVRAGVWSGTCEVWFFPGELDQFAGQIENLYQDLRGTICFRPMEPNIEITLDVDGRGHILVTGRARQDIAGGNHLNFAFTLDQTALPVLAVSLRKAEAFQAPDRGR